MPHCRARPQGQAGARTGSTPTTSSEPGPGCAPGRAAPRAGGFPHTPRSGRGETGSTGVHVMPQGRHHRIHAQDRLHRNRQRVAQEAARLMSEHGIRDYHQAKLKAAERMGVDDEQALPRNREIEQALRERQRIFHGHEQPQALRRRREAALARPWASWPVSSRAWSARYWTARPTTIRRSACTCSATIRRRCRTSCANTASRSSRAPAACGWIASDRRIPGLPIPADELPFDLTVFPRWRCARPRCGASTSVPWSAPRSARWTRCWPRARRARTKRASRTLAIRATAATQNAPASGAFR